LREDKPFQRLIRSRCSSRSIASPVQNVFHNPGAGGRGLFFCAYFPNTEKDVEGWKNTTALEENPETALA
jgi:hypothetical protein